VDVRLALSYVADVQRLAGGRHELHDPDRADSALRALFERRLLETLREHGWLVGRLVALTMYTALPFNLMFIYIVSWLQLADGIPPAQALEINTISMIVLLPVMLAAGWLSDRYGRKPLMLASAALGFVLALPLFWVMLNPALALLGQLCIVLIIGPYIGVTPALLVEMAPTRVRCTAVALGYNLCLAVTGGTTPLIAAWLVDRTATEISPALLIMLGAAITTAALLCTKETAGTQISFLGQERQNSQA